MNDEDCAEMGILVSFLHSLTSVLRYLNRFRVVSRLDVRGVVSF